MTSNNLTVTEDLPDEVVQALLEEFGKNLEPISPQESVDLYLDHRSDDLSPNTKDDYESDLDYLVEYCCENGIDNLNDFGGRDIQKFAKWRKEESPQKVEELSAKTMRDKLYLLKNFLRFLENIDGVERDTAEKVDVPTLKNGEGIRDVEIDITRLQDITAYLAKFRYASREHVVIKIVEETGRRLGGVHSLDLCDVYLDRSDPYIEFNHHDDGNTRLKNGNKSEQQVNISNELADLIRDYIEYERIEKEVDGRKPLLTTNEGRLAKSTIRSYFYRWTRPCKVGKACPEDIDPEDCQAASSKDHASKCPVSEATHAAKHGNITELLRQGVPKAVISERCDVSEEIIEQVYDERTDEEKREQRREHINEAIGRGDE